MKLGALGCHNPSPGDTGQGGSSNGPSKIKTDGYPGPVQPLNAVVHLSLTGRYFFAVLLSPVLDGFE